MYIFNITIVLFSGEEEESEGRSIENVEGAEISDNSEITRDGEKGG